MKPDTQNHAGLYQPLPCPDTPWHTIYIDFATGLPEDEAYSTVMIVMDRFLKMCSSILLSSTTASNVSTAFFKEVIAQYGVPRQIVSDHNQQFTSEF